MYTFIYIQRERERKMPQKHDHQNDNGIYLRVKGMYMTFMFFHIVF